MSNAITWQNIAAPSYRDAFLGMGQAQQTINSAFGQADKLLDNHIKAKDNSQVQALLDVVSTARTPEEMAALQSSGQLQQMMQGMSVDARAKARYADEQRLKTLYTDQEAALGRGDAAQKRQLTQVDFDNKMATEAEKPIMAAANAAFIKGDFAGGNRLIEDAVKAGTLRADSGATALAAGVQKQDAATKRTNDTEDRAQTILDRGRLNINNARTDAVAAVKQPGDIIQAENAVQAARDTQLEYTASNVANITMQSLRDNWEKENPKPPVMASPEIQKAYQDKRNADMLKWPDIVRVSYTNAGGKNPDAYLKANSDKLSTTAPTVGVAAVDAAQKAAIDNLILTNGGAAEVRQKRINETLINKIPNTAKAYEPTRKAVQEWTSKTLSVDVGGGKKVEIPMPEEFIREAINSLKVDNSSFFEWSNNTGDNFDKVMKAAINDKDRVKAIAQKYAAQGSSAGRAAAGSTDPSVLSQALYGTPNPNNTTPGVGPNFKAIENMGIKQNATFYPWSSGK